MKIVDRIRSLFLKPKPVAVSEEPEFLLPETAEEYRQILAEKEAEVEMFRLALEKKADQVLAEARRLDTEEAEILLRSFSEPNEAKAEILRRDAEKKRKEAEDTRLIASRVRITAEHPELWYRMPAEQWLVYSPESWNSRPQVAAERQARDWERDRIAGKGTIIFSTVRSRANSSEEEASSKPKSWDRVERRIVIYQGKCFLWQLRSRAVVRVNRMVRPGYTGGPYFPATYSYSPTGEYGVLETEFVTNSVAQMTECELTAAASAQ